MEYLNRKDCAYHVEVGDEVMFLSNFEKATEGEKGKVTSKGDEHVEVELVARTAYEQENPSLRQKLVITDENMSVLAFSGELQEYEPKPEPKVEAPADTKEKEVDDKKDGDDKKDEKIKEPGTGVGEGQIKGPTEKTTA